MVSDKDDLKLLIDFGQFKYAGFGQIAFDELLIMGYNINHGYFEKVKFEDFISLLYAR